MQIRLGNKQDEPTIATLVQEVMTEHGLSFEPNAAEADLKNIEANYFGADGIFLVAEADRQILGIACARSESDDDLELVRLAVLKPFRRQGIAKKLLATVLSFAQDMGYKKIVVEPARQYSANEDVLRAFDFTSDPSEDAQKPWYYKVDVQSRK